MLGMASPSGYLDLESQSVTGAAQDGTGTVDGVQVTYYRVAVDPSKLVDAPGMSADEISTVNAAVGVLHQEGYTGTEARVALDAAGYIRQVTSVASFADGGTVTLASTFSNFGCAGTVTMPGEPTAPPPPADCTSPVPSTTTTTAPPVSTTLDARRGRVDDRTGRVDERTDDVHDPRSDGDVRPYRVDGTHCSHQPVP